jgi:hypothetical protein
MRILAPYRLRNFRGWQHVPRIDWRHPLATGLAFCSVTQVNSVYDLVSGKVASIATFNASPVTPYGHVFTPGATDVTKADFGTWQPLTGGDTTVFVIANPAASGSQQPALFNQRQHSPDNTQINLLMNSDKDGVAISGQFALYVQAGAGVVGMGSTVSGFVDGNFHAFAGKFISGSAASVWCDGVNVSGIGYAIVTGTVVGANQAIVVGGCGAQVFDGYAANCPIPLVLGWNRALSDAEMRYIGKSPYCFLIYPEDEMWARLPAAGGLTLSPRTAVFM